MQTIACQPRRELSALIIALAFAPLASAAVNALDGRLLISGLKAVGKLLDPRMNNSSACSATN